MKKAVTFIFAIFFFILNTGVVYAHKGKQHPATPQSDKNPHTGEPIHIEKEESPTFKKINESYVKNIKPIFTQKCMDCHSSETRYPWYYKIPGFKQMIDKDIEEGREHIEFTGDFPFKSHASPSEDLDAIAEVARDGSMPPFGYKLFHWGSGLTEEEKKAILEWVEEAKRELHH